MTGESAIVLRGRSSARTAWIAVLVLLALVLPRQGVRAEADLALQSSPLIPVPLVVGRSLSFTLTVTNRGPDAATGITLTNWVPPTLSVLAADPSQGASSVDNGIIVCAFGDLGSQQSATLLVSAVPNAPGVLTNLAVVASLTADPDSANNATTNAAPVRLPYLSVAGTNVVEGNVGLTHLPFTIGLEYASPQTVSVDFQTANGSALAGADYLATNGTLIFPPGLATQTVLVPIIGDLLYETGRKANSEDFLFTLSHATNASVGQLAYALGEILDDDPMPSLSIADASVVEGESGSAQAVFAVSLSAPSGASTTFRWSTADATALAGQDYKARSITVTLPAGRTSTNAIVTVLGDALPECDETFLVNLTSPQGATIDRGQAVGTSIADELLLTLPGEGVAENAGTLTGAGQVAIPCAIGVSLVVTLANTAPDLVAVPTSVVIPAGETNALFDLIVFDDALLNGSRVASISAQAPLRTSPSASLTVHDDETTTLTLLSLAVIEQGFGGSTGVVQAAAAPATDVVVQLLNDNTNLVQTPDTILLPAGKLSASFQLHVPNDFALNGNPIVTLAAHVQNWTDGTATILVKDLTNLTVTLPTELVEGQWATGLVQTTAAALTNVPVFLLASTPAALSLPSFVEIPGGQLSNTFTFQAVDDALYRGTQAVAVTSSAEVWRGTSNAVLVLENDPDHFTISRVPVSREAYVVYYDLVLTACDPSGAPVPHFNRAATLTAAGLAGPVAVLPGTTWDFSQGVCTQDYYFRSWDNNVRLLVSDGQGHTGQSNPFNIVRPFHHGLNLAANDLIWDAVRGRICASVPAYWNAISNTLAFINPWNGRVESTFDIGPGPGRMAISDDSRFLYVALTGTNLVRRLNLATRTVDLEFSLGEHVLLPGITYPLFADDLHVQPGNAEVVAVARMRPTVSPRAAGVAVFDHGVMRPSVYGAIPSFGPNRIEFSGWPSRLYGYDTQVSTFTFHRMDVTASGVVGDTTALLMQGYGLDFTYGNGRIYVSNGQVFNPESGQLVGSFPNGVAPLPAPDIERVICIRQNGSQPDLLQIFDEPSLALLHQRFIPGAAGTAASPIRWGEAGVAFRTTASQVYVLWSDYLADLDADGLPDAWEREHFGGTAAAQGAPEADPDLDGRSNHEEWVAGTNPREAADVLRIGTPQVNEAEVTVTCSSVVGCCYRLERASDPVTGPWTKVHEQTGTGGLLTFTDSGESVPTTRFYRVQVFR